MHETISPSFSFSLSLSLLVPTCNFVFLSPSLLAISMLCPVFPPWLKLLSSGNLNAIVGFWGWGGVRPRCDCWALGGGRCLFSTVVDPSMMDLCIRSLFLAVAAVGDFSLLTAESFGRSGAEGGGAEVVKKEESSMSAALPAQTQDVSGGGGEQTDAGGPSEMDIDEKEKVEKAVVTPQVRNEGQVCADDIKVEADVENVELKRGESSNDAGVLAGCHDDSRYANYAMEKGDQPILLGLCNLSLSHSLSLSLTHSHTHTLSLTHSHTHTHTHTLSLSLSLSLTHTHTQKHTHYLYLKNTQK